MTFMRKGARQQEDSLFLSSYSECLSQISGEISQNDLWQADSKGLYLHFPRQSFGVISTLASQTILNVIFCGYG